MYKYFNPIFFNKERNSIKFLLCLSIFLTSFNFISYSAPDGEPHKIKTVVIDAGHGGKDPGSIGKNCKEKDIALVISLKVGNYIKENFENVNVIYTRETDVFVKLYDRAAIANKNNADLFISIHTNSVDNSSPHGTETFAMGLHKSAGNLEVAKKENSVILKEADYETNYSGFDPSSPESHIFFSLIQNVHLGQSLNFASKIQYQFRERVKRVDRGVKQAGLLVLWKTTMPSVLIETGFISNSEEEKFLISEQGQDYIASAIFRAFKEYKNEVDAKTNKLVIEDTKKDSIIFKVQLASSKKQIQPKPRKFKGIENVEEIKIKNSYKYTVGNETNFNQITELQTKIRERYPDAFVIAFKNGKKISVKEALKEINN